MPEHSRGIRIVWVMSRVPAEQRREQLIEATIDLAIREGLAATSVRRIADEASVSLGVVHYCFSSKEALLNAVAESFATPILGPVATAIEASRGFERTVRAAFTTFWEVTQSAPGRQLLSYELAAWSIRGDGEAARLLYQTYLDVIESFITEGMGITGSEALSSRTLARMTLALTDGIMLAWLVDRDDEATQAVIDAFVGILVAIVRDAERSGIVTVRDRDPEPDEADGQA
ncbi:putative TetR family transcriptional regulator [Kineosphaera limosa NBRC 100340]|uniref:Putative TetR family transcriptional regulator n=2 Tax=Kineosphaera TaxID=211469 RepID=K6WK10_9MICO|nr:putative TetR family transcriptional regulator [Kineosphaera limosa NBRC 100340]